MTDFSVRVSNLPEIKSYEELDELSAALTHHISKVIFYEDEVYAGSEHTGINPVEMVSINYA